MIPPDTFSSGGDDLTTTRSDNGFTFIDVPPRLK
jgi:hypothetical protein